MEFLSELTKFIDGLEEESSIDLAKKFLDQVSREILVNLLAKEIDSIRREDVRAAERLAFSGEFFEKFEQGDFKVSDNKRFAELMKSDLKLGDGFITKWGTATVEQHKQRIAFLEKMRSGIDKTISYHQSAIMIIEKAGVECLNDALVAV